MNYLVREQSYEKIKKEISLNKDKVIVFEPFDEKISRKIIEKLDVNIVLLSQEDKKDYLYQRNSGLNEVLGRIIKKNNCLVGINLDELITSKNKAKIIGRIIQNIKICNRLKINMIFISFKEKRDKYDLASLGLSLGMPTWMLKQS